VRLRVAARVIAMGLIAFAVRDLFIPDATWPGLRVAMIAVFVALAFLLRSDIRLDLSALRRLEVAMLASLSAWFMIDRVVTLSRQTVTGSAADIVYAIDFTTIVFVAFITAYAVFVPNTWVRALKVTAPLALAPAAATGIAWALYPGGREALAEAITFVGMSSRTLMLVLMVAVAASGARLIHSLRQEVYEARRLGQYHLIERIGAGGMGEVWRAEHRMLRRAVAVKLIRPDRIHASSPLQAREQLRAFEREAAATAALRSIHTVEIYDFGVTEDMVFYYVMEMLDGVDLNELVRRFGPQSESRVVHVLLQACESLEEAHTAGLVHRDIKPGNISICRLGPRTDVVKVLDFGLVASSEPERQASAVTAQSAFAGTPGYMAPEALRSGAVDARADLYGLGCVGYWLLTGQLVFDADSVADQIAAHLRQSPARPSERLAAPVDTALESTLMSCLSKDPAGRPESAAAMARELSKSALAGDWTQADAAKWWKANLTG